MTEREEAFKKRLNEKIDDRLRQARRDIDSVIDQLKEKSDALIEKASLPAAGAVVNTGKPGPPAPMRGPPSIASSRV